MKLQFNETFAAVIVALLLLVCFCRQVLQALAAAVELCDKCSAQWCDCRCVAALVQGDVPRRAVAMYCLFLPLTFNAVYFWHMTFSKFDWASSIMLVDFHAVRTNNATQIALTVETEVDCMFCVMPFALAASLNCWIWLSLSKDSSALLSHDTVWDDSLPECLLYYELAYCAELLAVNFSLIAVSSSGRTVYEVLYATTALTVVECCFVCGARHRRDGAVDRVTCAALTVLLVAVVLPLSLMLERDCVVAEAVAAVHVLCVCTIVGMHFAANGDATASSILAVRVGTTILASVAHLAVLVHGRNRACQT
jgi:hypothetical protein